MMLLLIIVFGLMMIASAFFAIYSKDMVAAIVAAGVVSLLASVLYLILGAPDVAMTEAAIGSALSVVVFLFAWSRIRKLEESKTAGSNVEQVNPEKEAQE